MPAPSARPRLSSAPPRPLRVLSLGMGWQPEQPGNGLDRVYHALATHLPGAGVDVRGLVSGSTAVRSSSTGRVSSFDAGSRSRPGWMRALRGAVRKHVRDGDPDVIASHFAYHTAPVLDLFRDRPLVVHFHGPWAEESAVEGAPSWKVRAKRGLERLVYRRAARCIVLSEAFRTVLTEHYGVPSDRIHVIPGGTDVDRFRTTGSRRAARLRLGWPTDRPTVLAVRRLVPRMGLDNLIAAARHVRAVVPNVLVLIAGSGALESILPEWIEADGLSDTVRLLGYVPDDELPFAYRAADLSVVPSVSLEGFGLITAESLAAGTPALVTPVGGLPETVRGLSAPLVLPDASVEALASGLSRALTGALPLPSANACRAYARQHYSWPTVAERVCEVYAAAVHAPSPTA